MQKFILIITAVIFMMACKKEETKSPTFLDEIDGLKFSKTEILNSIDSITGNPNDTIPNIEVIPSDCNSDNFWTFNNAEKSFILDNGTNKCKIEDPQIIEQGLVELLDNGTALRVAGTGTNEIWNIESRTAASFRVSYFAKNGSNKMVKFRVTFTKL